MPMGQITTPASEPFAASPSVCCKVLATERTLENRGRGWRRRPATWQRRAPSEGRDPYERGRRARRASLSMRWKGSSGRHEPCKVERTTRRREMRSENEVSRVLSIASGLALLVGLIACGGSDIVVPPPPTPVPTPTPPVVLDSGGG